MTKSDNRKNTPAKNATDRPSPPIRSVDRPWEDVRALEWRLKSRRGERAAHRSHHSPYEDMLY